MSDAEKPGFGASASGRAAARFAPSPFARLARTHAASVAGDALIALALADSLFFSIDPSAARGRVALYLLFTMAPFAVVAPLLGPALDRARGGRRMMVVALSIARVITAIFMMGELDSLLLFPLAFAMLVFGKGYLIAKSAIVPTTVDSDQALVEANSKLSIITGLSGFVIAIPGLLLSRIGGPEWVLGFAALVFSAGALLALRLPSVAVAEDPPDLEETEELRSRGVLLAATGMGFLRGAVGFLLFLLAFYFRGEDAPTWQLGVAVVGSVGGSFLGSVLAPRVRRTTEEEDILVGSLAVTFVFAVLALWQGGLAGAFLMSLGIGFCANTGKLAFDSIVQRDAPDANRGRSFARFETRFQVIWVIGAFIPVIIPLEAWMGYLILAVAAGFATATYWMGRRDARREATEVGRKRTEAVIENSERRRRRRSQRRSPEASDADGEADPPPPAPPPDGKRRLPGPLNATARRRPRRR